MRSRLFWLALVLLVLPPGAQPSALPAAPVMQQAPDDPDRLYADRRTPPSAERAAAVWEARLGLDPADFESAWKLARARYWLGGRRSRDEQRSQYERGVAAGRQALALEPKRPEGHFWMAANMGALAESFGLRQGLRYRGAIREALETVLRIDPAFQQGSADRALGRWYHKVPRLFGGSHQKAVEHLQRSLTYGPDSTASRYFLAEVFLDMSRRADARVELQRVLDAPLDPDWEPEDLEFKDKARELLGRLE